MTASAEDIIRDQSELSSLQRAIADVETAVRLSPPGTLRILESSLDGMKLRVATLDKKISEAIREREVQAQAQAAAFAVKAQMETRLSESEKQAYGDFLQKDFFTKQDFKSLAQFYGGAWERLTEDGKHEMSHRVWEGVRHGEYRFSDLPKFVQEKEAKLAYQDLANPSVGTHGSLAGLPDADRNDFLRAYRSGDRREVSRILERDSFRRNMAVDASKGIEHRTADAVNDVDTQAVVTRAKNGASSPNAAATSPPEGALAEINLDSVDLRSLQFADSTSAVASNLLPDASGSRLKVR